MLLMEGSEPSFVPEWLRSTGSGKFFASSQTDGHSSSLPKRNKASMSNSYTPYASFIDRSSSTNPRRNFSSNGCGKLDRNSYSRSINQPKKDRERLDTSIYEDSGSLRSIIAGRIEKDSLRRSQSMISSRPSEFSSHRVCTDLRNSSHSMKSNGNRTICVDRGSIGIQKVSLNRDFPLLGSDEKPTTTDIVRVPSSGLSKGVQGLSVGAASSIIRDSRASMLAEVSTGVGSNNCLYSPPQPPHAAAAAAATEPVSAPSASAPNGFNMAEALVKVSASNNGPQQSVKDQRSKELPFILSKRLIPVTPSMPKSLVHNPSDKLKPKAASRPIDVGGGSKNSLQQVSCSQLGSQPNRNAGARCDGLKSSSTGKMLLLKPAWENGVSPASKDTPSQTINATNMNANGMSTAAPSGSFVPLKNLNREKLSSTERKTCGLNGVSVADKRPSLAQQQSRNDFFNLVRKKSTSGFSTTCTGVIPSSGGESSDELKALASGAVSATENNSDLKWPIEEEEAFLRSLGWEKNAGDDEGLTDEEINDFFQKYKDRIPTSKVLRLQQKITTQSDSRPPHAALLLP